MSPTPVYYLHFSPSLCPLFLIIYSGRFFFLVAVQRSISIFQGNTILHTFKYYKAKLYSFLPPLLRNADPYLYGRVPFCACLSRPRGVGLPFLFYLSPPPPSTSFTIRNYHYYPGSIPIPALLLLCFIAFVLSFLLFLSSIIFCN